MTLKLTQNSGSTQVSDHALMAQVGSLFLPVSIKSETLSRVFIRYE